MNSTPVKTAIGHFPTPPPSVRIARIDVPRPESPSPHRYNLRRKKLDPIDFALDALPNELLQELFEWIAIPDLLMLRACCKVIKPNAEFVLGRRFKLVIPRLERDLLYADAIVQTLESEKQPRMEHYRTFLKNASIACLNNVASQEPVADETLTVVACLSVLYRGMDLSRAKWIGEDLILDTSSVERIKNWPNLVKLIKSSTFHTWFLRLGRLDIHEWIPVDHISPVESIIMNDDRIQYAHIRQVDQDSYRLLIVVAACIQVVHISNELKTKRQTAYGLQTRLNKLRLLAETLKLGTSFILPK